MLLRFSARNTSFLRCPSSHKRFVVHRLQTYVEIEHEAAFSDPARSLIYHGFVFYLIGKRLESKPQRPVSERTFNLKSTTNSGRSESAVPVRMHPQIQFQTLFFASASRRRGRSKNRSFRLPCSADNFCAHSFNWSASRIYVICRTEIRRENISDKLCFIAKRYEHRCSLYNVNTNPRNRGSHFPTFSPPLRTFHTSFTSFTNHKR